MLQGPIELSIGAYEVVWERAEIGVMPTPVAINYPLRSVQSGSTLAAAAFEELSEKGLLPAGQEHPDLVAALRLLATAPKRVWSMECARDSTDFTGTLIASTGDCAVLAQLHSDRLALWPVDPNAVSRTLIATMTPATPGRGQSLSVHEDSITADGRPLPREELDATILVAAQAKRTELDQLHTLLNRPKTAITYLYAATRDCSGNEHRCEKPLVAFDLDDGTRWFLRREHRDTGKWLVAAPSTPESLIAALCKL